MFTNLRENYQLSTTHLLCSTFSARLARRSGDSLSHNFYAEKQTHQQPLWHCGAFFPISFSSAYVHGMAQACLCTWHVIAHLPTYSMIYACVRTYAKPVCTNLISFSTRAPVQLLFTADQRRTQTRILRGPTNHRQAGTRFTETD